MHYCIYKITNILNDMIYIGAHQTNNLEDNYMGSGKYLWNAIKKYRIENFKKEILFQLDTVESMYRKEAEIVNEEFIARKDTYNIKLGGQGGWDYINVSGKNLYGKNGNKGFGRENLLIGNKLKEYLITEGKYDKWRFNISSSLKENWRQNGHSWVGRKHSEETKQKISEKNKINQQGSNNSNFGKIWINNMTLKQSKTIKKEELQKYLDQGWTKGRVCNFDKKEKKNIIKEKSINLKHLEIYKDYLITKSLRQTAQNFNVSHVTVSQIKKKFEKFKDGSLVQR